LKARLGSDQVLNLLKEFTKASKESSSPNERVMRPLDLQQIASGLAKLLPLNDVFVALGLFCEVMVIVLHCIFSDYTPIDVSDAARYPFYQDVNVMMFIGFGYLMTFLRKYGYTSVGITFLVTAFVVQWHPLLAGFWAGCFNKGVFSTIFMNFGMKGYKFIILNYYLVFYYFFFSHFRYSHQCRFRCRFSPHHNGRCLGQNITYPDAHHCAG
jgi:hypothetical protein